MMISLEEIRSKYTIQTQTLPEDQIAFESIEHIILEYLYARDLSPREALRNPSLPSSLPSYAYCETGSFLGGTLLPRMNSSSCARVLSIDKRVNEQDDERRAQGYSYQGVTCEQMTTLLSRAAPSNALQKLSTYEGTIDQYVRSGSSDRLYDWIFIDAEHTNIACFFDFLASLKMCKQDSVIALHDSWITYSGIANIGAMLNYCNISHSFAHLGGSVTAFFMGDLGYFIDRNRQKYLPHFITMDIASFIENSRRQLWRAQARETLLNPNFSL